MFEKNCNCFLIVHLKGFKCPYQIHNIGSILGHGLRRWPGIETLLNVFLLSNPETKRWSRFGHRGTLFTILAMNGESTDMSTIEPTLDPIIGLLPRQPKGSICSLTSTCKQILPFAFEEQHSAVSAHFTSKRKLPFAIQEYSDPENPGFIRKNTIDVFEKS